MSRSGSGLSPDVLALLIQERLDTELGIRLKAEPTSGGVRISRGLPRGRSSSTKPITLDLEEAEAYLVWLQGGNSGSVRVFRVAVTARTEPEVSAAAGLNPAPNYAGRYERVSGSGPEDFWIPPSTVELTISSSVDFTEQGWSRKVEAVGGTWARVRSVYDLDRSVSLPWPAARALIAEIAERFQARCLIFRGATSFTGTHGGYIDVTLSAREHVTAGKRGLRRITLGELEALLAEHVARAKAEGRIVEVETNTDLRFDELEWRQNRDAKATIVRKQAQIEDLRAKILELQGDIAHAETIRNSTDSGAYRHETRLKGEL